jgi:hypothetical protein
MTEKQVKWGERVLASDWSQLRAKRRKLAAEGILVEVVLSCVS